MSELAARLHKQRMLTPATPAGFIEHAFWSALFLFEIGLYTPEEVGERMERDTKRYIDMIKQKSRGGD
jgi:hypothetical protein